MKTNLNGICVNGRFYEAVKGSFDCKQCALNEMCYTEDGDLCNAFGGIENCHFRYSQSLTEKLNKE